MRIALVGWDIDAGVAGALAGLGTEVVAFTRWFAGEALREDRGGWTLVRCPHQLGGPDAEAASFGDSVRHQAGEQGVGAEFDAIHALDAAARPAAARLAERWPSAVRVVAASESDFDRPLPADLEGALTFWVCAHPWVGERWRAAHPEAAGRCRVILGPAAIPTGWTNAPPRRHEPGPVLALWVPRGSAVDPELVVEGFALAQETLPGASAVVLGDGPYAEPLRSRLARRGWLADPLPALTRDGCDYWIARAAAVGLAGDDPTSDPMARFAWLAGAPVFRLDADSALTLSNAITDAFFVAGRWKRDVQSGASLALREMEPAGIALQWLRLALDARAGVSEAGEDACAPALPTLLGRRTRLSLVAIGPREVYAAWSVRPDDWSTALEWLGADGARAALAIRFSDVTDLRFTGGNAHATWDVDVAPGEEHRTIGVDPPGRSLASALGVRSASGYFHPLATARLCHLPREGLAPTGDGRRLQARPRRGE